MKKFLCTMLLSMVVTVFAFGQTYTLQTQTGTYTDLTGVTSLNQGQTWDDPDYVVPVGFNFPFWGRTYSTIYVSDSYIALNVDYDTIISPFFGDLIDRGYSTGTSVSTIGYKNETVGGVQVLKIEWKNFGFYNEYDSLGTFDWFGNMQLWLYANGKWEVHIGPNSIPVPGTAFSWDPGPAIGYGHLAVNYWLTGSPANPTLSLNTTVPLTIPTLSGVPANGTKYIFTPTGIGLDEHSAQFAVAAYPNPVVGQLSMELPASGRIELFDLAGQRVRIVSGLSAGTHMLNLSAMAKGTYMLVFTSDGGARSTQRIVKQ